MANDNSGRKKQSNNSKKIKQKIVTLLTAILIVLAGTFYEVIIKNEIQETGSNITNNSSDSTEYIEGELLLTMIDVGQADGFLLEQNGKVALIDCGTRSTGKKVVEYLQSKGITKLDYVFGTHPHDDHMGGMYDVITNFEIGKIVIPEVNSGEVTSNWYIKLMTEIKDSSGSISYPNFDITIIERNIKKVENVKLTLKNK